MRRKHNNSHISMFPVVIGTLRSIEAALKRVARGEMCPNVLPWSLSAVMRGREVEAGGRDCADFSMGTFVTGFVTRLLTARLLDIDHARHWVTRVKWRGMRMIGHCAVFSRDTFVRNSASDRKKERHTCMWEVGRGAAMASNRQWWFSVNFLHQNECRCNI